MRKDEVELKGLRINLDPHKHIVNLCEVHCHWTIFFASSNRNVRFKVMLTAQYLHTGIGGSNRKWQRQVDLAPLNR